jgi:hypothetical protein
VVVVVVTAANAVLAGAVCGAAVAGCVLTWLLVIVSGLAEGLDDVGTDAAGAAADGAPIGSSGRSEVWGSDVSGVVVPLAMAALGPFDDEPELSARYRSSATIPNRDAAPIPFWTRRIVRLRLSPEGIGCPVRTRTSEISSSPIPTPRCFIQIHGRSHNLGR